MWTHKAQTHAVQGSTLHLKYSTFCLEENNVEIFFCLVQINDSLIFKKPLCVFNKLHICHFPIISSSKACFFFFFFNLLDHFNRHTESRGGLD